MMEDAPDDDATEAVEEVKEEKEKRRTQAQIVLELVKREKVTLFHDELKAPHALIPVNGHVEVWEIEGKRFQQYLSYLYYEETESALSQDAIGDI